MFKTGINNKYVWNAMYLSSHAAGLPPVERGSTLSGKDETGKINKQAVYICIYLHLPHKMK